ncbi:META domain-containing protein [Sedimentitalea sp. JM2-8]|uniref:META domain-containing protein n=1 Tax=Sedimentitalea xiamensis TaxID=3050037 RepID=A0ABT7FEK8_9RHOB|nr:META domain-containing protein [Sedimentitalea xiamensis]MDK3073556.1 META domain-containing protein [Sedimentitalea xiamensis]
MNKSLLYPFRPLFALLLVLLPAVAAAGEWTIVSVNGSTTLGEARISLDADGGITGNTGCNNFHGEGRFENANLVITKPLAVTKMACPGEDLASQERTILQLLQGATAFSHDPFSGAFTLSRGDDRLELAEDAPSVFDAGYVNTHGLSGPLNIRGGPGTDQPVVTRVLPGTLLRNLGCKTGADHDWCNIAFIDASGISGWAAAEYLQAAPAAVRAQQGLFDNIGTLPCRLGGDDGLCDFGIARDGNHSAVLVIYESEERERVLHFANGELAYAEIESGEEAGASESRVSDGKILVSLGAEQFEISQNLVVGNVE